MKYTKIITHDGLFHADEVLAIAFLRLFNIVSKGTEIVRSKRTNVDPEDLENPHVLILDVGGIYEPQKGNFDHHHDKELESTNVLILKHFLSDNEEMVQKLWHSLFNYVSEIDRGIRSKKGESAGFSAIIKSFYGSENGFEKALEIAERILEQYVRNAESAIESEKHWKGFKRLAGGKIVVMKEGDPFVSDWKRLGEDEGVQLLILPAQSGNGAYSLISRDSEVTKIAPHPNQTFLHNSQFMAVYSEQQFAIQHALEIVE